MFLSIPSYWWMKSQLLHFYFISALVGDQRLTSAAPCWPAGRWPASSGGSSPGPACVAAWGASAVGGTRCTAAALSTTCRTSAAGSASGPHRRPRRLCRSVTACWRACAGVCRWAGTAWWWWGGWTCWRWGSPASSGCRGPNSCGRCSLSAWTIKQKEKLCKYVLTCIFTDGLWINIFFLCY